MHDKKLFFLAFLLSNHIFYGYQRSVDLKSKLFTTMSTNDYLAAVAVKHGFQNYVKVSNRNLRNQIRGFVTAQNKNGHKYIHEVTRAFKQNFTQHNFFLVSRSTAVPRVPRKHRCSRNGP